MTKIAQILEIVKTEFPLPRKEMIAKIVTATGATPGSANSFYYYALKELGLKTAKAPKAAKAKTEKPPKAPKAPKVRKTAVLKVAEPVRPFESAAAKFLAWRQKQEGEVEFAEAEVAEFEPTSEWEVSESEEARELLRIMAG